MSNWAVSVVSQKQLSLTLLDDIPIFRNTNYSHPDFGTNLLYQFYIESQFGVTKAWYRKTSIMRSDTDCACIRCVAVASLPRWIDTGHFTVTNYLTNIDLSRRDLLEYFLTFDPMLVCSNPENGRADFCCWPIYLRITSWSKAIRYKYTRKSSWEIV